ncbi:MAG TPA: hypothetical protein VGC37_08650 [Friedmanniella sp.]
MAGTDLVPVDHPRQIRNAHQSAVAGRPALRRELEKLRALMPGTLDVEDRSAADVDASIERAYSEALAELEIELGKEPQQNLLDHWRRLGGRLPDPLWPRGCRRAPDQTLPMDGRRTRRAVLSNMSSDDEVAACRTCGGKVVIRPRRMRERAITEAAARVEQVRVCTNPNCPTKGRDRALGDVV